MAQRFIYPAVLTGLPLIAMLIVIMQRVSANTTRYGLPIPWADR